MVITSDPYYFTSVLCAVDSYKAGDVVIMTPVNTQRGAVPSVLHLQWMKPHILMDYTCLGPLGIRIGKVYVTDVILLLIVCSPLNRIG